MSKKEDEQNMANGFHVTAVKNYISLSNFVWVILRKISIQSTNPNSSLAHSVKMEKVHLYSLTIMVMVIVVSLIAANQRGVTFS